MADAIAAAGHTPRYWGLGAHSDMGLPTDMGNTPTIMLGPGDPTQAHQPNEMVPVADLIETTKVMALGIRRWCA
jgi:acetylornithine deacetylase